MRRGFRDGPRAAGRWLRWPNNLGLVVLNTVALRLHLQGELGDLEPREGRAVRAGTTGQGRAGGISSLGQAAPGLVDIPLAVRLAGDAARTLGLVDGGVADAKAPCGLTRGGGQLRHGGNLPPHVMAMLALSEGTKGALAGGFKSGDGSGLIQAGAAAEHARSKRSLAISVWSKHHRRAGERQAERIRAGTMQSHWKALTVLTLARISMGFQFQSVASVSPDLVSQLGLTYADLGTLIGLYFLPGVVLALPGAALGRRFGDKRVVCFGLLLMAAGGLWTAWASSFASLAAGRLLSGVGGVLLNVLMAKMVTDSFAGRREIVVAMAVFVNSFPIGVGLATLSLGWLGGLAGWSTSFAATSALAVAALILLSRAYAKHPNDGRGAAGGTTISASEVALVCVAGAIWGIFNGAFAVMFGFAPTFLTIDGLSATAAGLIIGTATWMVVASVQAGGILAQRWGRPAMFMAVGGLGWAVCLAALAVEAGPPGAALLGAGLLMGLPVGVIMSLPAQALRPESRALGLGIFYTWLYIGHGLMPPVAGWLQDVTGSAAAPLLFTAVLVAAMLPLYGLFQIIAQRRAHSVKHS